MKNLRAVNPRKAAGPDRIPGAVVKACADQLTGILTKLFNLSLIHATIYTCLKASTIIPIPKKPAIQKVGCIHDGVQTAYRAEVKDLSGWCSDNNLTLNIISLK